MLEIASILVSLGEWMPQSMPHRASERTMRVRQVRQTRFSPQMEEVIVSEQEQLQENDGKPVTTQEIATFDDEHTRHVPFDNKDKYEINNVYIDPTLDTFLLRPIKISTTSWTSGSALGTLLASWVFPDSYFTTTVKNKLEKVAFWRPTFEITIRMNGTPMHYGKLLFNWIPQAATLNPAHTGNYISASSNKWVQVSAAANQATVITIPFCHYREMINVGKIDPDLFTLYCWVTVPLSSVNGTPPPVNFSVYARVLETRLAGFNWWTDWAVQSFEPQAGEPQRIRTKNQKSEAEDKTDGLKVVSSSVSNLGDAISKFSWLPAIGGLASPISESVKALGGVLKFFGLSSPLNLQLSVPMQVRQPRFLQVEDAPTSLNLSCRADLTTAKDYSLVNDTMESSGILKFMQRPGLLYTGTITAAMATNQALFSAYVRPIDNSYDYLAAPAEPFKTIPVNWMTRFFDFWRGGTRIHLSFVASHFHSCRVRVWYVPYNRPTGTEDPGLIFTEDVVHVVIDITKETDYSFTIPYMQQTEWLNVDDGFSDPASQYTDNGYWGMTLVNPLTSGAATVAPIYYQVWVSAAEDYQVAGPNGDLLATYGSFKPQSEFNVLECEIPSSSLQCLTEKEYPPLGDVAKGRVNHGVYHPLEITGIKQLTNLLAPIVSWLPGATDMSGYSIRPMGDPMIYSIARRSNYQLNMMTVFRYWKGSYRMVVRSRDPAIISQAKIRCLTNLDTTFMITTATAEDFNNLSADSTARGITRGSAQFQLHDNPVDVTTPDYNIYKCHPTSNSTPAVQPDLFRGYVTDIRTVSPANNYVSLHMCGGDDFILGWQLGIPALTKVTPPT